MELEKIVLGEILNDSKIIDEVTTIINLDCFQNQTNRIIYKSLLDLNNEGKSIDTISLYEIIKKNQHDVPAVEISRLTQNISSSANFYNHCCGLLETWMRREIIKKSKTAQERASKGDDVFEIISSLSEDIYQIENNVKIESDKDLYSEIPALLSKIEDKYLGKIPEGLKSSSFPSLNKATGGIMSTDFVVIYGKEKAGKTTVAERIGLDIAFQGIPVAIFTLEMDFDSSSYKALSMEGGLKYLKLRNPKGQGLTEEEFGTFLKNIQKFEKTKIFIDDRTFDFDRIIGKMKLLKRKYNIGLFIIDYLGLIEINKRFEARRLEIKHYSRRLKNLCKELNTPIIAISQANDNEKTAESVDPLRDCDFALRCSKPIEDGSPGMKTLNGNFYSFTEDDFVVTVERSRHGKNKQNFVCSYTNNDFKEKDITHLEY